MNRRVILRAILIIAFLPVLLAAFGAGALAETAQPEPSPEATVECECATPQPETTPTADAPAPTATTVLGGVVETRTPQPTATPGAIDEEVDRFARATGVNQVRFLELSGTDWLNLGASLLLVLLGYALATLLIRVVLPKVVRRTSTTLDDKLLQAFGPDVRWVLTLLAVNLATVRLTFLGVEVKIILGDVYYILGAVIVFRLTWKLIDLADKWYREYLSGEDRAEEMDPLLVLLDRLARIVLVLIGFIILLGHFGVNVSALIAALGIGGLAFSLAAKDTLADAIAGFIILVDRPFRIGDRIEIQGIGTWGDVVDIGLRTTRIRTRDNRMVIVPNSNIGSNQVINYTFPDPRYRIETEVGIAYDTDMDKATEVIVDAVRQVDGVLPDKPVDVLYNEMGDSAMVFRVRWWIESYQDMRRMLDKVHRALQLAFDQAGIESPFPTQEINVKIESEEP